MVKKKLVIIVNPMDFHPFLNVQERKSVSGIICYLYIRITASNCSWVESDDFDSSESRGGGSQGARHRKSSTFELAKDKIPAS